MVIFNENLLDQINQVMKISKKKYLMRLISDEARRTDQLKCTDYNDENEGISQNQSSDKLIFGYQSRNMSVCILYSNS